MVGNNSKKYHSNHIYSLIQMGYEIKDIFLAMRSYGSDIHVIIHYLKQKQSIHLNHNAANTNAENQLHATQPTQDIPPSRNVPSDDPTTLSPNHQNEPKNIVSNKWNNLYSPSNSCNKSPSIEYNNKQHENEHEAQSNVETMDEDISLHDSITNKSIRPDPMVKTSDVSCSNVVQITYEKLTAQLAKYDHVFQLGLSDKQWHRLLTIVTLSMSIGLNIACPGLANLINAVSKCLQGDIKGALINLAFGVVALISCGIAQIGVAAELAQLIWGEAVDLNVVGDLSEKLLDVMQPFTQSFLSEIDVYFKEIHNEILDYLHVELDIDDAIVLEQIVVDPLRTLCGEICVCIRQLQDAADNDALDDKMIGSFELLMVKMTTKFIEEIPEQIMEAMLRRSKYLNASEDDIEYSKFRYAETMEDLVTDIILDKIMPNIQTILNKEVDPDLLNKLSLFDKCSEDIEENYNENNCILSEQQLHSFSVMI